MKKTVWIKLLAVVFCILSLQNLSKVYGYFDANRIREIHQKSVESLDASIKSAEVCLTDPEKRQVLMELGNLEKFGWKKKRAFLKEKNEI